MNRALVLAAGVGAIAAIAWYGSRELELDYGLAELGADLEELAGVSPSAYDLAAVADEPNVRAFLLMIRDAEGTAGRNGYRMLFGGQLFDTFADHPRIPVTRPLGGRVITSTAAGAYQFLERTWDEISGRLQLEDFGPESQDLAAIGRIRYRGALELVRAGRFDDAVAKVNKEWASLPGSPYGQPVKTLDRVRAIYEGAGGSFA